jgi:site-specific DNA-cytosine methylase
MQTERKAFNKNKKTIINRVNNLKPGEYCRLRKITPDESLRFMGISDEHIYYMLNPRLSLQERGYTDEQIDEMLVVDNHEADIYKQAGNSIVVDVLYHIFRKMFVEKGAEKGQTIPIEI